MHLIVPMRACHSRISFVARDRLDTVGIIETAVYSTRITFIIQNEIIVHRYRSFLIIFPGFSFFDRVIPRRIIPSRNGILII